MLEFSGKKWVHLKYTDGSELIFQGVVDANILKMFEQEPLKENEVYNMNTGRVIVIDENVVVEVTTEEPVYTHEVSKFVSRFV